MRLARGPDQAHVQARIVLEHGSDAGQHRAGAGPPGVAVGAGGFRGDPLAHAVLETGLAVERRGDFHPYPRGLADHAAQEADVEFPGLLRTRPDFDLDARGAQPLEALPGDQRVGVGEGRDDAAHARRDQRVAARAGAAMVGAGLQRDPGSRANGGIAPRRRIAQRHDFGMRAADLLGVALADHVAVRGDQHAADAGLGIGLGAGLAREIQRLNHEIRGLICHFF